MGQLLVVPPPVGGMTVPSQGCRWEVMCPCPPQSVFDLLGCPHSMGKTGSVSAAVLPLGKSVAVGSGLSDPLILCGGRLWLLADMVLLVAVSWLCHPPVATLFYAAPFPSREKFPFFVGISTFLARHAHAGTARSLCNHLQTSYGARLFQNLPWENGWFSGSSSCLPRESQPVQWDPFPKQPFLVGVSLLSTLGIPGQSMSAHTCPWSVR